MKNYIQEGDYIDVAAPAEVSSGDVVIIGNLIGVAVTDAEAAASVSLAMEGVFSLAKGSAEFEVGDFVYHDGTECTAAATDALIGVCVEDAATADGTVKVRLGGGSGAPESAPEA